MRLIPTLFLTALLALAAAPADAERVNLGWGRLFTNDALGDMKDRWRTGGYVISVLRGPEGTTALPPRPGEVLEFRLRSEVIAPASLTRTAPGDRRYAGVLSAGVHTLFAWGPLDTSVGVDLVAVGPMTGIAGFQKAAHAAFGLERPSVTDSQLPNRIHPTLTAEVGRTFVFTDSLSFRPYAEVVAGAETLARIGGDVLIGPAGQRDIRLRDVVTGQRYVATDGGSKGFGLSFGGDVARVWDSEFLGGDNGPAPADTRTRLRAGLAWNGARSAVFYGVTWLGKEFEGQPEGQVVGSLRLHVRF
jgi:hypothetical protein